ncbi:MAG: SPASM domain-containing protein [Acidobacteria bacterium]|nr:SPASM domain-containing protein [Acidobacteriota bacterium]MBI3655451.1 SPASM domain-containing protein [Acidobacteriota bacterium]
MAILWSYLSKRTIVHGGPKYVLIEATGKCNLFCPMCPRELVHFEPVDIPLPLFKKVIEEARGFLEFTVPYGAGEPMLNPRIFEMITFCRAHNIRIGLSTNGTLNNPERNHKLLESGLNYIIFAFDGATKESYEKYRKGAKFEETRAKILEFLKMKRKLRSKIFTIIQMVRLKDNADEVEAFREMWNIPGVDQVRIKEDELQFEGIGIPRLQEQPQRRNPCHYLWQGPVYVHHDGNVFPCCYMWRGEPLGNANQQPLVQIWNNERMQKLRQAHIDGNLAAYHECVNCHAPRPRMPVILGSFVVNSLAVRKWIPIFEKLSLLLKIPIFENRPAEMTTPAQRPPAGRQGKGNVAV